MQIRYVNGSTIKGVMGLIIFGTWHIASAYHRIYKSRAVALYIRQRRSRGGDPAATPTLRRALLRFRSRNLRDMDDPELEAIRQRRMQELMAKHGSGNQQNGEQQKAQEEAKREAEEHRQLMLSQILSAQARERRNQELILVHAEKCILGNNVISRKGLRRWVNELARNPKAASVQLMFVQLIVARIALVKPDKARGVEDVLLRAAQMGQLTEKV
ncbi:hypothetical protein BHE74_00009264 [Ensete ventricosum]|nr:hypothetical protein BHE74_00009264 [Ensete ventricosum]